ncbi:hypothetical protein [Massilia niabensis]|uniref:Uncharacterized protein n=1 Tax=Massilia niabensis TaxID=544910 RepID=A0ABW0LA31_9BURK
MKTKALQYKYLPWAAAAALLGVAAFAIAQAGVADDGACGLGLPPGHPGFAQQEAQQAAEVEQNGFLRACKANLERYSVTFFPLALAGTGLAFEPVDLAGTPFARLNSLGGRSERMSGTPSRFYRGFRTVEGHTLTLFEHDMSADGSSMHRDPKLELERVNGLPARLVVLQAGAGEAVSVLSWLQGRRYYELWLEANAARDPLRRQLFALAESLPPSIPGCPKEIPPKRVSLGADGFPDIPMPLVLTQEQVDAMDAPRPCR